MKFTGYTTSFQEVPGEVSIAISVSGCPHRCQGCHSAYLREDTGTDLNSHTLLDVISKYQSPHTGAYTITCVCFLGGEQHGDDFLNLVKFVRELGLKVCLYTGATSVPDTVKCALDFVKVGPYIETKGPLTSRTTNQRFYRLVDNVDLTHLFWED